MPEIDEYILDLPEGMTAESLSAKLSPPPKPDATAEPPKPAVDAQPTPPAAPAPAPAPAPVRPGVVRRPVAVPDAETEAARLRQQIADATRRSRVESRQAPQARANVAAPQIQLTDADLQRIKQEAENAPDQGGVAAVAARVVTEKFNAALKDLASGVSAAANQPNDPTAALRSREDDFIEGDPSRGIPAHPHYDEFLWRAGIYRAIEVIQPAVIDKATGTVVKPARLRNQGLADLIYGAEDPISMGYRVAKQILLDKGLIDRDPDATTTEVVEPESAPAAAPAPVPAAPSRAAAAQAPAPAAPPTAEQIREAEQRGRVQAVAEITETAAVRGRGIRSVVTAGAPPRVALDKRALDDLMFRDYDSYLKLIEANPQLEFDHMSA